MSFVSDTVRNSGWGLLYGLTIQSLIYPLEGVKLRQQDPLCSQRSDRLARELYQREGLRAFYRGLFSKLADTGQKQLWRWPLIVQLPPLLKSYGYNNNQQQVLTGLTIATVDALLGTPFDALKLTAIYGLQSKVTWRGFPSCWAKRAVEWTTFLWAQSHFSNQQQREDKASLKPAQSLAAAVQIALLVSVARAPFDVVNTLRQTGKTLHLKGTSPRELVRRFYRGAPLGFCALLIQNFCATILIDKLRHTH